MVEQIAHVSELMSQIDLASQQQAAGISQIHIMLSQMDQVTQQNAALVEQAAAASESMQAQTESLTSTVSLFVIETINGVGPTYASDAYSLVPKGVVGSSATLRIQGAYP